MSSEGTLEAFLAVCGADDFVDSVETRGSKKTNKVLKYRVLGPVFPSLLMPPQAVVRSQPICPYG
jgi:hypothetical protein